MILFQDEYNRTLQNIAGVFGTFESSEYAIEVEKAIDKAHAALRNEASHRANVSVDYLKGWLAEQWHAETLKVSGAARGRSDVWANVPGDNGPGDVQFGDSTAFREAQVKYWKSGEDTAKAISSPKYEGMEKVVPADQLGPVKEAAERLAQKNEIKRPAQAAHYKDTATRADVHLSQGNASSKPLAESDAKDMAKDFRNDGDINSDKYGLKSENVVEWSDVARQASEAALHAAVLSAALSAAPHIWATLKAYIDTGELDSDILSYRARSVLFSAGTSGLRGGVAAGLTAACKTGLMGSSVKNVSPLAIGMATTLAINAIEYSIQLQQGKISNHEFARRCVRDTFVLSTGMVGATVGQLFIPIPLFGALAGNLVGSTLGAVIFEGGSQVILGICVESGWTFFGIVKQDSVIPEDVLRKAGYDLFSTHSFTTRSFSISGFSVQGFNVNSLSFLPVRRGVISCSAIGYL